MAEAESIGLAHDYLLVMRGAERTFAEIAGCWPEAPIYTSLYSEAGTEGRFHDRDVITSRLQRLGLDQGSFRRGLPLYGRAFRSMPLADHDLLVSSSSAFAHQIRTPSGGFHVCYCHTPFRYAWHERRRALEEAPAPLRPALGAWLGHARRSDLKAARRVGAYIANSETTRERIGRVYGREAEVVHPPVAVERFAPATPQDYYLVVSELLAHKRIETAIEATRLSGDRLFVVGGGPALERLATVAHPGVQFLGRVGDEDLATLYAGARAVIVTAVEEFGIVAVEAQASGRPVIAPAQGGASETILDGRTGRLLEDPGAAAVAAAIGELAASGLDPAEAVANAARFSPERFRERLLAAIERVRP